jgi:hypothetical protein
MKFTIGNDTQKQAAIEYIGRLPDRLYTVTVEKTRQQRTLSENALYWLWVTCIADETGMDKDAVHFEFKARFIGYEQVKGLFDVPIMRPISTTTLDTSQFKQYLDKIQIFASAELGIVLPSPDDKAFEAFNEYYKDRL